MFIDIAMPNCGNNKNQNTHLRTNTDQNKKKDNKTYKR